MTFKGLKTFEIYFESTATKKYGGFVNQKEKGVWRISHKATSAQSKT
jgi:hypothetical protein